MKNSGEFRSVGDNQSYNMYTIPKCNPTVGGSSLRIPTDPKRNKLLMKALFS